MICAAGPQLEKKQKRGVKALFDNLVGVFKRKPKAEQEDINVAEE